MTMLENINHKNNAWALAFLCLLLWGSFAGTAKAGINEWTPSGLEGGAISALAIDPSDPATLYAGAFGGVYKSSNAGASWQAVNSGLVEEVLMTTVDVSAVVIDPVNPATLYAGTPFGGIYKSSNAGVSWQAVNTGLTNLSVSTVAIDPVNPTTLYAGTLGGLYKSSNAGVSWQAVNNLSVSTVAIDPVNPRKAERGSGSAE